MEFLSPIFLYFFILVPIYIFLNFFFEKRNKKDAIPFGNYDVLASAINKTKKIDTLKYLPLILKTLILSLIIFGMARPVSTLYLPMKDTKIMFLFDISISMEADDIKPNRLEGAKATAIKFIKELPKDIQTGITLFSGNVKVLAEPSLDKSKTLAVLESLSLDSLERGTAIGDAIIAGTQSINAFDKDKSRNKGNRILVLLTDGETNIGADPLFSAAKAKTDNIIIHSIGIGNPAGAIIRGGILTRPDEYTLKEISSLTGGEYFNAKNINDFHEVYKKIKSTIHMTPQKTEITFIPLTISFILLVILQVLKWSKFRFA